jgi:FkbM family methyltransferase
LVVVFGKRDYGLPEPGALVVDIGANIGAFSVAALQRGCEVYAFEPEPSNFELLRVNAPEAEAYPFAVTRTGGRRKLYVRDSPSHSLYPRGPEPAVEIESISLADVMNRLERVDLLKLDIEGGEYEVLYGAQLERVREIRMEYHHFADNPDPQLRFDALRRYLENTGFALVLHRPISQMSGIAWFCRP